MTGIVVDASVAIGWFAEELGSAKARQLQLSPEPLLAPAFLLAEIGNALLTKTRRGAAPAGFAALVLAELRTSKAIALFESADLAEPACVIAERLSHPIHDCLYLVLAQREQASLATFDTRLAALAERLAIPLWSPDPAP